MADETTDGKRARARSGLLAAAEVLYQGQLGREPTAAEWAEFRRPRSDKEINELVDSLFAAFKARCEETDRQVAETLAGIEVSQQRAEELLAEMKESKTVTVTLPINFGSAASYIEAIERGARKNGIRCQTRILKTGLLSKRVYFELTGQSLTLSYFMDSLREWAIQSGIGWTSI